jgi:hypothetical protein
MELWTISPLVALTTRFSATSFWQKSLVLLNYFPVQGGILRPTFPDGNHPITETTVCNGSNVVPIIV